MIDQFYTPSGLAGLLISAAKARSPKVVADFAMGDGALLRAARQRWPRTLLVGSDINPEALSASEDVIQGLDFSTYDFLGDAPLPEALRNSRAKCDVIVLNPPFTCRGSKRFPVTVGGEALLGSKALAFVCRALAFLKPSGEALAILPASCITSERDDALLKALRKSFVVDQIGEISRNAFEGCSVNVIIVRIRKRSVLSIKRTPAAPSKLVAMKPYQARIMRGTTAVHTTALLSDGWPLVHTSDLRSDEIAPKRWTNAPRRVVEGDAVLLPRVGRPDAAKLVLVSLPETVLSDCVIALQSSPTGFERELFRLIRSKWPDLEAAYGGSCAPYITLSQLQTFLLGIGVASEPVADMRLHLPSLCQSLSGSVRATG